MHNINNDICPHSSSLSWEKIKQYLLRFWLKHQKTAPLSDLRNVYICLVNNYIIYIHILHINYSLTGIICTIIWY